MTAGAAFRPATYDGQLVVRRHANTGDWQTAAEHWLQVLLRAALDAQTARHSRYAVVSRERAALEVAAAQQAVGAWFHQVVTRGPEAAVRRLVDAWEDTR